MGQGRKMHVVIGLVFEEYMNQDNGIFNAAILHDMVQTIEIVTE